MIEPNTPVNELPSLESSEAWEAPILFDEIVTRDISANLLPDCLGEFSKALSEATETPEALSVMCVLGVISTCLSKRFVVSPKAGWEELVNIYTAIAMPPANNKSAVLKNCLKPLVDWEREQEALLNGKIKRQISERKTQEKIIENLRLRASKTQDSLEQKQLFQDILDKEAMLVEPEVLPVLFANDATPEALLQSVAEQDGRFAIFSDEGGILETLSGLYSNGVANIDVLLKGIDGVDLRVKRKDKLSTHINPYLTIVLAVQPDIISNMSKKRSYTGNGMLERFLYVIPKSELGYRKNDTPPVPEEIKTAYYNKIKSLLAIPPLTEHGQEKPCVLKLEAAALADWREFQKGIEEELRPNRKLNLCQGWGGKICGFTLRIAGLLHVAEHSSCYNLIINQKTMLQAIQIAILLIEHAIAAYGLMGVDHPTQDAKEVFRWIKNNCKLSFTKTEVTNGFRNKKMSLESLNKALNHLLERNIINEPRKLLTRKPTTVFDVNPEVLV